MLDLSELQRSRPDTASGGGPILVGTWTDQRVETPGFVRGLPIERYHEQVCVGPSFSSSSLRTVFSQSPAHYWATSSLNPRRIVSEASEAFVLGAAAHHLLLGEAGFAAKYAVRPVEWNDWRTAAARSWRGEQRQQGRQVVEPRHLEIIQGMANALAEHPLIAAGILGGEVETSMFWRDTEAELWLKARPDAIPNWSGDFADLKTCNSVRTEALERTIAEFGYHQQAALVGEGYRVLTGRDLTSFSFVFVEKAPPYCVRVVTLRDADIERGRQQNRAALRIIRTCLDSGHWPGPGAADAEFVGLPWWEETRIDQALATMAREYA